MTRFLTICLLSGFGILISLSSWAENLGITWVKNDLTPFYIQDGPDAGRGISDQLTTFFQSRLTDFPHQQEKMNFSRFFALAQRGELVCNPLLLKTPEREKFLHYSKPFKPNYAHVLVSRIKPAPEKNVVYLADYLALESPALVIQAKRSYGPELDEILARAKKAGSVRADALPTKQLLTMLRHGRIEHFIDVESSVTYFDSQQNTGHHLYYSSIAEDRLDRFGYAVCSKTPLGKMVIDQINQIIDQEKASPAFRSILESWIAPQNLARFREFYEREIIAKP